MLICKLQIELKWQGNIYNFAVLFFFSSLFSKAFSLILLPTAHKSM